MPPPNLPIPTNITPTPPKSAQPAQPAQPAPIQATIPPNTPPISRKTKNGYQQRIKELETKNKELFDKGKKIQAAFIDLKSRFDAAKKAGLWLQNQLTTLLAYNQEILTYQNKLEHEKATVAEQNSLLWSYISQTLTQRYELPTQEEMRSMFKPMSSSDKKEPAAQAKTSENANSQQRPN